MGGKQSAHDGSRVAEHLTLSTHKPPRQGFRVIKLGIIIIRHSNIEWSKITAMRVGFVQFFPTLDF